MSTSTASAPSTITQEQVDHFVEQGFLVCEHLLAEQEIAELQADLLALARGRYPCEALQPLEGGITEDEALRRILCIHQPHWVSPVIEGFLKHPAIAAVLSRVVGAHLPASWWDGSVKCMQSMYFAKGPGKPGQAWHQDEIYIPTRDRSLIGAWIAVDDATVDNGCLWVLPGSHRASTNPTCSNRTDSHTEFPSETNVAGTAGSVLIMDSRLWHATAPNRADEPRVALAVRYAPWWLNLEVLRRESDERRFLCDATGKTDNAVPSIDRAVYEALPPRVQQLYRHWVAPADCP